MDNIQKGVIIKIQTDTSQAQAGVQQLGQSLNNLGKTDVGTQSVQSLKAAIREANSEAQIALRTFGATSPQFVDAAQKVAELKLQFKQYRETVEAFNPANKLQAVVSVARGATGAIEGVAGAMAFLGGESEKNEEILRRLHGLMLFSESLNRVEDIKNSFKNLGLVLGITTKAQQQLNTAQQQGAITAGEQAAAQEGVTVATEASTVAADGLGVAFKALGIGLIVAVVAALVSHWDELVDGIEKVIPGLKSAGEWFGKLVDVIKGVGNVIVKSVIAPFKAIWAALHGHFKEAINDLKEGANITKNFEEGYAAARKERAEEHARDLLKINIETEKRRVEVLKSGGKDYYVAQKKLLDDQLELARQNAKEVLKIGENLSAEQINQLSKTQKELYYKFLDAKKDIEVADGEHNKKMEEDRKKRQEKAEEDRRKREEEAKRKQDEYDQLLDQATEYYKGLRDVEDKANEEMSETHRTEREDELAKNKADTDRATQDLQDKFAKEKEHLDKALKDKAITQAQYDAMFEDMEIQNTGAINLVHEAGLKKDADINKKYSDKVVEFLKEANTKQLDTFDQKRAEIKKKIEEILKDVTDATQKANILAVQDQQLKKVDVEENLHKNTVSSQTNLINTQTKNLANADDNPETKAAKAKAILDAEISVENAAYQEKLEAAKGNKEELENLEAQHNQKMAQFSQSRQTIDKAENDAKVAITENALNTVADIVGKNTVAGKAISVASATISTYEGASKALATGGFWGIAQAAVVIAAGLANVKKIIDTKIPGHADNVSQPSITAPTLDTAHLTNQSATQNVRVVNQPDQPIRTFITQKDLSDNEARTSLVNSFRSF